MARYNISMPPQVRKWAEDLARAQAMRVSTYLTQLVRDEWNRRHPATGAIRYPAARPESSYIQDADLITPAEVRRRFSGRHRKRT